MNRWTVLLAAILACIVLAMGCSKGGNSPVTPGDITANQAPAGGYTQTHLWGFYDVYVDIPTQTATAVPNRDVMFAANVVQFLNGSPANLSFIVNGTPAGASWIDVDIDVKIKHPFTGMTQYNGYDVRGIFMGNGSKVMKYDNQLKYAAKKSNGATTDQVMFDYGDIAADPHPGKVGGPDGYSRWFNATEFATPGVLGYTKGMYASAGYLPTATLNPYKYYADNLDVGTNLWSFLKTATKNGCMFSSGAVNTRNYYLRFPNSTGVKFAYAVVANWKSELPADHPSHAPEAVGLSVGIRPDVYYESATDKGGKLKLTMDFLRTWGEVPSTIWVESTVLTTPYQLSTPEMTPIGGGSYYSTYYVEIPATNITGNSSTVDHEFWIIPQYDGFDYKNEFGVTNLAGDDKLAAFFRYDLYVSFKKYCAEVKTYAINFPVDGANAYAKPYTGITITGAGYTGPTCTVAFKLGTTTTINASNVVTNGTTQITCDADFTGAPAGSYDAVITNNCGNIGTKVGLFQVICPAPVATAANPSSLPLGGSGTVTFTCNGPLLAGAPLGVTIIPTGTGSNIVGTSPTIVDATHISAAFAIPTSAYAGTYNVQITNGCGSVGTTTTPPFSVICASPLASAASPASMGPGTTVTVTFTCAGPVIAGPSLGATLIPTGVGSNIVGTSPTVIDSTHVSAVFYAPPTAYQGNYNVQITNGCGTSATTTTPIFMVIDPCANLTYSCTAPPSGAYDSQFELTSGYNTWSGWDDGALNVALPFTFNFGGTSYTSMYIMTNYGVGFGGYQTWYTSGCPPTQTYAGIQVFQADMDTYCHGQARYGLKTIGTQQYFVVWYYDIARYYCSGDYYFMIVLKNGCTTTHDGFMVQYGSGASGFTGSFRTLSGGGCCITSSSTASTSFKYGNF